MVTVANLVKKYIDMMQDGLSRDIISVGNLAEELHQQIEKELGKKVKLPAIVMAIRRYAENVKKGMEYFKAPEGFNLSMKSNIIDIGVSKSAHLLTKLDKLYDLVSFERGEMMNVIQGSYEVSIITNDKYEKKVLTLLKHEKILNIEKDLGALSLSFGKEFLYTPGVIYLAVKELAWNNINIFELVSTNTELTFILNKEDCIRAYGVMEKLVKK
jgi:aspartokinase